MAVAKKPNKPAPEVKEFTFRWVGKNKAGRVVRGEQQASTVAVVNATLRRQGILPTKVSKQGARRGGSVKEKDVALLTRQLATMMRAGVPLLQTFEIVGRGHDNPAVSKLLLDIKSEVETGSSLSQAFRKFPLHFDALYCNLIEAGEQAGILEAILERLAIKKEKTMALKAQIKSAMTYPIAILGVAFAVTAVIMVFVVPAFKTVFASFGAQLPGPTLVIMGISDFVVSNGWIILIILLGSISAFFYTWKRSEPMQIAMDRLLLRMPIFGSLVRKSVIARWTRTLATMFAAGVPLVESLNSVGGAAGNHVYKVATKQIQNDVSSGVSLTSAMQTSQLFPNMVVQMIAIGEESGALDSMLSKVADFFEAEVDEAVKGLSSLMEPIIMVVLGVLIGGMVIAMYLPIFKMGAVAG